MPFVKIWYHYHITESNEETDSDASKNSYVLLVCNGESVVLKKSILAQQSGFFRAKHGGEIKM